MVNFSFQTQSNRSHYYHKSNNILLVLFETNERMIQSDT